MSEAVPRTYVYLQNNALTFAVSESVEEVQDLWEQAAQSSVDDKVATITLTNIHPPFEPYPVVVGPGSILALEQIQPLQARYSTEQSTKRWAEIERDLDRGSTGFGGDA